MDLTGDKTPSQGELLRQIITRLFSEVNCAIPAKIESFDHGTQEIECIPMIRRRVRDKDGNESLEDYEKLIKVPLLTPYVRMLGFSLTMPITPGDICLLIFADRGIDLWQEDGEISDPPESKSSRTHNLTDGIAIMMPIPLSDPIIDYQLDSAELRNIDRTTACQVADEWSEMRAVLGNYTTWTDGGDITSYAPGDIEKTAIFNIDLTAGVSIDMFAGIDITSTTPGAISESAGKSITQTAPAIIDTAESTHTVTAPTQTSNSANRTVNSTAAYTLNSVATTINGTTTVNVDGGVVNVAGATVVNTTAPSILLNGVVQVVGSLAVNGVEVGGHIHAHGDPFTGPPV